MNSGSVAQILLHCATQSMYTWPLGVLAGTVPHDVSVCSTQCIAVLGVMVVEVPILVPSRENVTDPGAHSTTALCQAPPMGVDEPNQFWPPAALAKCAK